MSSFSLALMCIRGEGGAAEVLPFVGKICKAFTKLLSLTRTHHPCFFSVKVL